MRKARFTEHQIIAVIKSVEAVVLSMAARTWYVRITFKLRDRYCLQWDEYHVVVGQCVRARIQRFTLDDLQTGAS